MAVATVRVGELLTKNADKVVSLTSSKPAPGLILNAPTSNEAKSGTSASVLSHQESRSVSPISRVAVSWTSTSWLEEIGSVQQEDEGTRGVKQETEPSGDGRRVSKPMTISEELQSCPSFGEQSCKPLWIDRHNTLQRAYSDAPRTRDNDDDSDEVDEDCESKENHDSKDVADGLEKYLPTWDIAKSQVWLLAEAALQQAQLQAAAAEAAQQCFLRSHPSGGTRSELEPMAEEDLDPTPITTTTANPAPTAATTPFVCPLGEAHPAADLAACHLPPLLAYRHTAPLPLPAAAASLQSLGGALRRTRYTSRAAFPTIPLGLGRALASSPSSFGAGRGACTAAASRARSGGGGGGCSVDGHAELHSHGGRQHVAFAAGLAAATSAAAAVSQAAGVAAAGLSAATSLGSAASLALELGAKALSAGGGVLVDRVQSIASRHATAAAAKLILGPSASPAARDVLVNRVQATVAGASIAWFLLNLASMSETLTHLDFEHDFASSVKVVLDLATSGPSLMENCKELMHIGVAVSLRVAQRNGGGAIGGVMSGGLEA